MTDKPSEAAIREACRRAGYKNEAYANAMVKNEAMDGAIALAASLIEKYEPETLIDPVTKWARVLLGEEAERVGSFDDAERYVNGDWDNEPQTLAVIRALKEGMTQ